jgi:uncharacterized protein (DUF1778 family)
MKRVRRQQMTAAALVRHDDPVLRRGVTINLRAPQALRDLIDSAAAIVGQNRSEFMLDSARRRAEDVLLDQRLFMLDEEKYAAFLNLLDQPPRPTKELRRLLSTRAPWEK